MLFLKTINKLVVWIIAIKEDAKIVMFWSKKTDQIWKIYQTFRRIAKFLMVDSKEMDFMKGIGILVQLDEMYNILKSANHCLLVER